MCGVHFWAKDYLIMMCSQREKQEFFLGKGGVVGLLQALVGSSDSMGPAYAELNAFGRGPTIVTLPASVLNQIRQQATDGRAEFQQLELDMFRLAAVYLVEGMQQEVMDAATMFFLEFGLVRVCQRIVKCKCLGSGHHLYYAHKIFSGAGQNHASALLAHCQFLKFMPIDCYYLYPWP